MKETLFSNHFILPPSSFILPKTRSLTLAFPPQTCALSVNETPPIGKRAPRKCDDGLQGEERLSTKEQEAARTESTNFVQFRVASWMSSYLPFTPNSR